MKRLPLVVALAMLWSLLIALPASATGAPPRTPEAVFASGSTNLTPTEQVGVRTALAGVHLVKTSSRVTTPRLLTPAWSNPRERVRCWEDYEFYEGQTVVGTVMYTLWQGLNWCSVSWDSGYSYNVYRGTVFARGGETKSPFYTFNGDVGFTSPNMWNLGWEIRSVTEERFEVNVGWYHSTATPCVQIRGGARGLTWSLPDCHLNA